MGLTKCPGRRRLSFVEAESCPNCARVFRTGETRARAVAEGLAFFRRYNSLFAALFLLALAVLAFVMLKGT